MTLSLTLVLGTVPWAAAESGSPKSGPLVSKAIEEGIPAAPPPRGLPQDPSASPRKGMSKVTWAALIAGFAVTGVLVYHYATGPGASVRNCSTCQK